MVCIDLCILVPWLSAFVGCQTAKDFLGASVGQPNRPAEAEDAKGREKFC